MTDSFWLDLLIGIAAALLLAWLALVIALLVARPRGGLLHEALRVGPDLLRLIPRLAADKTLPRGVRLRLGLLLVYLALPIDLIPDFIPVLGYANDAIILAVGLRSVVRRAGIDAVRAHWPGTDDGFVAIGRLVGLDESSSWPPRPDDSVATESTRGDAPRADPRESGRRGPWTRLAGIGRRGWSRPPRSRAHDPQCCGSKAGDPKVQPCRSRAVISVISVCWASMMA